MLAVLDRIDARRASLAAHCLFAELDRKESLHAFLGFAPRLAPWVVAFQDLMRRNAEQAQSGELRVLLTRHGAEEGGHDRWYFEDLELLTGSPASSFLAPSPEQGAARDLAHHLLAEVQQLDTDALRVVLLLSIEATSDVFFHHVAPRIAALGGSDLKYFSEHHVACEEAHEVFEEMLAQRIRALTLTPEARAAALALVDRTFTAFEALFDALRGAPPLPRAVPLRRAGGYG